MPVPKQPTSAVAVLLLALIAFRAGAAEESVSSETVDTSALAEKAQKSVVVIRQYSRDGKEYGIGAGFVVAPDGVIATCLHVIGQGRPLTVALANGQHYDVMEIVASDRKLDLAVVRVAATHLPTLPLGDSGTLKQGAPVVAIGNPVGLEHSVVQGVVSAKREVEGVELIQLAIPLEPGNSGGPLLDRHGRVQGLLSMKSALTPNLGFAVPVNALKSLLDRPNPVPMARWLTLDALNAAEWKPIMGAHWSRKAGRIQVEGMGEGFGGRSLCLWQKAVPPLPQELSVAVKLDDESGAAGLIFAADGADQHYGFYPTGGQLRLTRFDGPSVFSWTILKEIRTPFYKPGEWNTLGVRVETNRIVGYVNGQLVLESNDDARRGGTVGLAKFRNTKAQFKDFYISTNAPEVRRPSLSRESLDAALHLEGASARNDEDIIGRLQSSGAGGRTALLERARRLEEEAQQMRRVASALHAKSIESALVAALSGPESQIDLFHAALLVAKLDNADLDVDAYHTELAHLAEELKGQLEPDSTEASKIAALSKFLFTERGFHGSRTDYYNPSNSYMNEVMDDREGLPITLAVLYLELARQIGLTNVIGLPLPTHFMVGFRPAGQPQEIIDVFDGGKTLTRSEAVELVVDNAESVGDDAFRPATKRSIIIRMLHNLVGDAERNGHPSDALRYLEVIVALNPDSPTDRLDRARLKVQRGQKESAKDDLRWLLEHKPAGVDLERLEELFRSL